ncbi:MAG: hypothetical protein RSB18_00650, partial [Clostridia bacterium]
ATPETMLALSSAVLNRAGDTCLGAVNDALTQMNFTRGFRVNARAAQAAQAALSGTRTLPAHITHVSRAPVPLSTALGGYYFY